MLWELHKTEKADDGTDDFSQHPDRLRLEARERRRTEQDIVNTRMAGQEDAAKYSIPVSVGIQEPVAALKRSQQMFEEKKARREERRSFRESDDFIDVQGVNSRTGYPDPNSGTSSSAGDVVSESTRQKLEDERRMATASREYKAALGRRANEMRRLERERERRREKKERAEKKRAQLRARVRKDGRWRNDGNTWSMVTEPGLSPIEKSIAGTPTHGKQSIPSFANC